MLHDEKFYPRRTKASVGSSGGSSEGSSGGSSVGSSEGSNVFMTNNILSIDRLLNLYNESLFKNRELQKELDWYKNYCDELIEHKDMICLPADLRNLRESNAKLAIENDELKKIITQKWYDETAQKQIDIMIKNQSFPKDLYEEK